MENLRFFRILWQISDSRSHLHILAPLSDLGAACRFSRHLMIFGAASPILELLVDFGLELLDEGHLITKLQLRVQLHGFVEGFDCLR